MADETLTNPVTIQAQRIDASILPAVFSQPYLLYVIQQSVDAGNVANKANEAADGAYQAQERNDEQDLILVNHEQRISSNEQTLINHENRITSNEQTLADHESRIAANESQIFDHESRITTNEGQLANHEFRIGQNEVDIDNLQSRMATAESDIDYLESVAIDHEARISALEDYAYRIKSEVVYSSVSLAITTTKVNLLQLLGTLTPTSGSLSPFFDTTTGLMTGLNKDKNLFFKLSIRGTYDNSSGNRSMEFEFGTVVPDTIVRSRDVSVSDDNVFIATFFSVEIDDDITDPGITIDIKANGSSFTATDIKIIATQ